MLNLSRSRSKFLNWEAIFLQIFINRLVELVRHTRWTIENPQVLVIRATNNSITIWGIKSHNPVISFNTQRLREGDFQFSICMFCIFWIRKSFTNYFMLYSIFVASVIDSDSTISIERVVCDVAYTASFEKVLDDCDLIPSSKISSHVDIGDCFGWISLKIAIFVVVWGQSDSWEYNE